MLEITGEHKYRNNAKAFEISHSSWEKAKNNNLTHLKVNFTGRNESYQSIETGKEFINICSCSYLGLSSHPKVLQGAIDSIKQEQVLHLSMSTLRIRLGMKQRLEDELSSLFNATVLQVLSASVANAGVLPVLASGHLTDGKPLVMVFDKYSHFSMAYMKPACADETLVLTCPNNDVNFIEDVCKKYPRVAYITDAVYSMGGIATLPELMQLQEKYGLFLFFDDSHSISIKGKVGQGYIASQLGELNDRMVVVGSFAKGFGGSGGFVMLGSPKYADTLRRYGGPMGWSQDMNVPGMGAVLASLEIHKTPELAELQKKLLDNIALFDELYPTVNAGNGFPIRRATFGEDDDAVWAAKRMMDNGFYTSPVFFPIVSRGQAGIRIMMRANLDTKDIVRLVDCLKEAERELQEKRAH
jgi:7-keto-8-aminopelargonate synthetase-like enzyme